MIRSEELTAAFLDNTITDAEVQELQLWLKSDPQHLRAFVEANAREQHLRGSYSAAQVAYEQFLEDYPNHDLAPDAHFNLADMITQQDRAEDALEAFQEIQALYPTSSRVPDALYRIAQLQVEMGDADDARATLERIMNTYPEATIAMLARDLLEEIS